MITNPKITLDHPFLRRMVPEHRSVMIQGAEQKAFDAGEVLFREGQPANRLFLIHEGKLALETHVPGHGDIPIAAFGKDQVLGWSWLVPPYVWHFQARALELTKVTVLNGGHLLVASEKNQYLGYELMKGISKVILESLLAAHQRWLDTGYRPKIDLAEKGSAPALGSPGASLPALLGDLSFFHGLSTEHLSLLASLARPTRFEPGQKLFEIGNTATGLYVIDQGKIVLEARAPDGPVPVQLVRPGDTVGWSAFCEPYEWHFDARATESTATLFISAADLRERCARDYQLGYEVVKRVTRIMLQRLQSTRNRIWEACR